jgi:hypothetical protein
MMHDHTNPFVGVWHCRYWYPSNDHDGEDISEYYVQAYQRGRELILESLPNKEESYIFIRLSIDNELATGNWEENTSPHGAFKGAIYSGAVQLLVDSHKRYMEGQWVGIGHDYDLKRARIDTGGWEMKRIDKVPDDADLYAVAAVA